MGLLLVEYKGIYYIADVCRGQWSDLTRNKMIQQCAELDRQRYLGIVTWIEAGGAGYADVAASIIRECAGHHMRADPITSKSGGKELRAGAVAAACENGSVKLISGNWNSAFLDVVCVFPNGAHDDDVDALSGAFNKMVAGKRMLVG